MMDLIQLSKKRKDFIFRRNNSKLQEGKKLISGETNQNSEPISREAQSFQSPHWINH
jgi:hypothetical protein